MVEYLREDIISIVKDYFDKTLNYKPKDYSDKYNVRVPIYCKPKKGIDGNDIVVEITTDTSISQDRFFKPIDDEDIRNRLSKMHEVLGSPLIFFQYYFPTAEIYLALSKDAEKGEKFSDFEDFCKIKNIGLIKVSNLRRDKGEVTGKVEMTPHPSTLSKFVHGELESFFKEDKNKDGDEKKDLVDYYIHEFLDYLVLYPDPIYTRRAISGDIQKHILFLMDKVEDLKYLSFREQLLNLSNEYRQKSGSDYVVTSRFLKDLWKNNLGFDYPNPEIQEQFEVIFSKNENETKKKDDSTSEEFTYREHFLHQFQVFLLGAFIIDKLYDSEKRQAIDEFLEKFGVRLEVAWLAASTYHDYNYSTQIYDKWLKKYLEEVLQLENSAVKKELTKLNLDFATVREKFLLTSENVMSGLFSTLEQSMSEEIRENLNLFLYEKIANERNHGLLSGLTLLKLYDSASKSNTENSGVESELIPRKAIERAALAISLHDERMWEYMCGCRGYLHEAKTCDKCPENGDGCKTWKKAIRECSVLEKINFDTFPLIYLLIYCDCCQDEGRVGIESKGIETILEDLRFDKEKGILITLSARDPKSCTFKRKELQRLGTFLKDEFFAIYLHGPKEEFKM